MRKISLSVCVAFAFFVTAAVAQMAPSSGTQGTQNSSPSMSQPGQEPGAQTSQQPGMGQGTADNNNATQGKSNGEKHLKGCVQSQGGQYVLETKHGKDVALTGSDVSAHVGHEVAVKGNWESGGSSAASSNSGTATGNSGASERTFNVESVKMISDTCSGKKGSSGNMGNSGSMGNGNGTGTGTGTTTPNSGTGTGTQPPQ